MPYTHPFQRLLALKYNAEVDHPRRLLVAAAGPCLLTFDLESDRLLGQWPLDSDDENNDQEDYHSDGRAPKRRKLSTDGAGALVKQESNESIEIVAEREKGTWRRPKVVNTKLPNVSLLTGTSDGRYVIAATVDDKAVIVLEVGSSGRLKALSKRCMPKRLCALTLTPDEKTIVVGDKFGDVYSLPLLPSGGWIAPVKPEAFRAEYKPSATELTVHTKGNLDALKQQQLQKQKQPKKEGPDFEHHLLLGHVSLLTDVKVAELGTADTYAFVSSMDYYNAELETNGPKRQYILTADRDEHIRVSRGVKQAHIIENYCLGQKEFISTIQILPWEKGILIVGGGELCLRTYDWLNGELLHENLFPEELKMAISNIMPERESMDRLAVSGIWPVWSDEGHDEEDCEACRNGEHCEDRKDYNERFRQGYVVLVALERMPLLISCGIDGEGKIVIWRAMPMRGPVLDVALQEKEAGILISIFDSNYTNPSHQQQNIAADETSIELQQVFLEAYALKQLIGTRAPHSIQRYTAAANDWIPWNDAPKCYSPDLLGIEELKIPGGAQAQSLKEFLYGLENLRKKRDLNGAEDGQSDGEAVLAGDEQTVDT